MKKPSSLLLGALLLLAGSSAAYASNFRVADTVYLPAAIHGPGQAGAFFRTDVWITNLSSDRIQVEVAFAPTSPDRNNPIDNRNVTQPPPTGTLRRLATPIDPGQRREIVDILQSLFQVGDNPGASGMLIFFGIRDVATPNVNCEIAGNDCRLISVASRTYTTNASGNTFGQEMPGIPWYSYISIDSQDIVGSAVISGFRVNADFRSNLGLANASQYSTTTIRVRLFGENGQQFGSDYIQTLRPLSHVQFGIADVFPGFSGTGYVSLEQTTVTPTNPGDPNVGTGLPGFLAYGSLIDQDTNDPTTLEPVFTRPFSDLQAQCIFTPAGKNAPKRAVRR